MASRGGWYDREGYGGYAGREGEGEWRSNVLRVQGWEVDRSPPPPAPQGHASPRLLKRRREHEDDREEYEYDDDRFATFQRRPPAGFHFNVPAPVSSPAPAPSYAEIDATKTAANRLPSISSLNLPKIKDGSQTMLMRPVQDVGAQRVPSFAALLNAI